MNIQSKVKKESAEKQFNGVAFAMPLESFIKLKPFISKEETRYYLQGVLVEPHPEGALAIATDGHRLGVQFAKDAICNEAKVWRVPAEMKVNKKSPSWVVGTINDGIARLHLVATSIPKDAQSDTAELASLRTDKSTVSFGNAIVADLTAYPNWRHILPEKHETDAERAFRGEYVKSFGNAVVLRGRDNSAPHIVETDDPDFFGVLMPMRMNGSKKAWVDAIKKEVF